MVTGMKCTTGSKHARYGNYILYNIIGAGPPICTSEGLLRLSPDQGGVEECVEGHWETVCRANNDCSADGQSRGKHHNYIS